MRSFPKWAWVCLMAFSLMMYGCGGGGGGSSDPVDPPTTPTPSNVDLTGLSTATLTAGMHDIAAGGSYTSGDITFMCAAGGDACKLTITADGMASSTGGMVTADYSAAAKTRMAKAAKDEAMRVAGLIGQKPMLADANAETTGNQSIVMLTTPPSDENFSMPEFKTTSADGTDTEVAFKKSTDMMPASISGWNGGMHTHTSTDGNTKHTVVMYDDKAADKDATYFAFFSSANAGSDSHRAGKGLSAAADGILTIDNGEVGDNHGLFTGNFGPTTQGTYTFPSAASVDGTFRGVAGEFLCSTRCTSTHDKDGNLSSLSGTWTFEPKGIRNSKGNLFTDADAGADNPADALTDALKAIMVSGMIQDADYMIFGYWEQSVTDADDETTETMLPFADGKRTYGGVSSVTGTATYSGAATGLYMMNAVTAQGLATDPFTSGQFTADAELEASFGGGNIGTNHQFSVTGTISNFMSGGKAINSAWVVNLNRPADDDTTAGTNESLNITQSDGTFTGVTNGGTLHFAPGEWSGEFYGVAGTNNAQPVSAAGIFNAHFTNGHVRGAFAANK